MALSDFDPVRLLIKLGILRSTGLPFPAPFVVAAKTTSYTILPSDGCGTHFTNRGAAGAVTFTLPGPTAVVAGTWYQFTAVATQNVIVATAIADTLGTINDLAADSVTISTSMQIVGAHATAWTDGTQWFYNGDTVGITYTIAT